MPHPRLNILDLPVDILALILRPLLTAPGGGVISLCPCSASPINPLSILLIHPSLYAITCPLFYGVANKFVLDLTGRHGGHVRRCLKETAGEQEEMERNGRQQPSQLRQMGEKFLLLSLEARRRVQRLEMGIDRLRGWVWDELGPLLEDMAVQGELADFCLTVCYNDSSGKSGKAKNAATSASSVAEAGGIFERPPMAGLLRLLADPDLRTARLRVTAVHTRAWCGFHAGSGCGPSYMTSQRTGNGDIEEEEEEEEELMEIDWRAILREVDPEGKERAVAWAIEG